MTSNFKNLYTSNNPPIEVRLIRGRTVESIHKVHAVVCDIRGRVLMCAGNPEYSTFIRSALKPFQAIPFLNSGAAFKLSKASNAIAIACGSHKGSISHAREVFKILWEFDIDSSLLQCPIKNQSKLEHNCSGKHAAFLATCKKLNWSLDNYLEGNHPLQQEIFRNVSEILKIPLTELNAERDDCGAPTLMLKLDQMANLYAHLSGSDKAELEQISRAMRANPFLISGENGFDTEIIKGSHGQIISKGGSEGIQCIGKLSEGLAIAIKSEDGSQRAKRAVALHLLKQLEWITISRLQDIEEKIFKYQPGVNLEVKGNVKFQET
tara:strand:+ start:259 stop:1224 length:966 start_codon:yes stop_codon:yes gene_type:complete